MSSRATHVRMVEGVAVAWSSLLHSQPFHSKQDLPGEQALFTLCMLSLYVSPGHRVLFVSPSILFTHPLTWGFPFDLLFLLTFSLVDRLFPGS